MLRQHKINVKRQSYASVTVKTDRSSREARGVMEEYLFEGFNRCHGVRLVQWSIVFRDYSRTEVYGLVIGIETRLHLVPRGHFTFTSPYSVGRRLLSAKRRIEMSSEKPSLEKFQN